MTGHTVSTSLKIFNMDILVETNCIYTISNTYWIKESKKNRYLSSIRRRKYSKTRNVLCVPIPYTSRHY